MKSLLKISLAVITAGLITSTIAHSQDRGNGRVRTSPNAGVSQTIGTTIVSVTYGRPALKGREIEKLVPPGKVWRTGANESTAITFSDSVEFGGETIEEGTYSLYTVTDGYDFYFIINSKLSWGTQYDESLDIKRIKVPLKETSFTERFTIGFDSLSDTSGHLNLNWGPYQASVPITTGG